LSASSGNGRCAAFASSHGARKLMELSSAPFEPVRGGRIYIEKIKGRSLFGSRARLRNTRRALIARLWPMSVARPSLAK
jgi:hypothetical protein